MSLWYETWQNPGFKRTPDPGYDLIMEKGRRESPSSNTQYGNDDCCLTPYSAKIGVHFFRAFWNIWARENWYKCDVLCHVKGKEWGWKCPFLSRLAIFDRRKVCSAPPRLASTPVLTPSSLTLCGIAQNYLMKGCFMSPRLPFPRSEAISQRSKHHSLMPPKCIFGRLPSPIYL